ncbi:MAG: hypothetical protein CFH40_01449 [Alphaproteobacteria bacterium MarineAlpha10_Bin3]|jgi:hypothetical protein|nr:MAG: hypothetical protein CFH40_01449 [Alphaproteobacteria bacterium MarineAlpha10_Bin3]PPR70648.1 MAG: hypothetical protein CFH09_01449 [Alphaproteobacteria bacterium MarineAlpha4_Bin1]
MSILEYEALRRAVLNTEPFDHIIATGAIAREKVQEVGRDFPVLERPGSIPLGKLEYGPAFARLIDDLKGPELTRIVSEKFDIDLTGRPTMITVRGWCRPRDGKIHTDSRRKLVTLLLYMNTGWESGGGRLRLLRSPGDIEDYGAEVPPDGETLLIFKCTPNAWHGHKSFDGKRRTIQVNWVSDEKYLRWEQRRHGISTFFKRLGAAF